MRKRCNKCRAKTLPPLAVMCAGMLEASLGCGACGESWRIKLHPLLRLGAFLWLVLVCSMSTYAGILMFSLVADCDRVGSTGRTAVLQRLVWRAGKAI